MTTQRTLSAEYRAITQPINGAGCPAFQVEGRALMIVGMVRRHNRI